MNTAAPYAPNNTASMQAAYEISEKLTGIRASVFRYIKSCGEYGATGSEIATALSVLPYTAKPRCTELRDWGFIKDSGNLRLNRNKRNETVWVFCSDAPEKKKLKLAGISALDIFESSLELDQGQYVLYLSPSEVDVILKKLRSK
jgi:hypothetical protein